MTKSVHTYDERAEYHRSLNGPERQSVVPHGVQGNKT